MRLTPYLKGMRCAKYITMGCCRLLMLGMLLHLTPGSEMTGKRSDLKEAIILAEGRHNFDIVLHNAATDEDGAGGPEEAVEIQRHVTAVLGDDVYLRCWYRGNATIVAAIWKRQRKSSVDPRLAGFNNGVPFRRVSHFSEPASATNLTARVSVSSVEAEGEYTCAFKSQEAEEFARTMFLEVHVRPEIQISVTEEMDNGTHYQSVRCSAVGGKPASTIRWLVGDEPPVGDHFTVEESGDFISVLHFPTHLQDEDRVACAVDHPSLAVPIVTAVNVKTFVAPSVSVQVEDEEVEEGEEEEEYWRVSCMASGGRPETTISLVTAPDDDDDKESPRMDSGADAGMRAYHLPMHAYEGHDATCVFDHPKLPATQLRTVRLPSFHLSGVQLLANGINEMQPLLELEEGQRDVSIGLRAVGRVPRYAVSCRKEDASPLPGDVEVVGRVLTFRGPVALPHAGLYECEASYYRHRAAVQINITVRPRPVLVPPSIRLDLRSGPSDRKVECSVASATPAASVSWRLPAGAAAVSNVTLHNGSHSFTTVLSLAACFPQELTVGCVIDHPHFQTPENRSVTIPLCAPPNISLSSGEECSGGEEYTVARCRVDSVATAANITWRLGEGGDFGDTVGIDHLEGVDVRTEVERSVGGGGGVATALSTARLPSLLYSGRTLRCVVAGHPSLRRPERRDLLIPVREVPVLNLSLEGLGSSGLLQAVCDHQAEGVNASLTWAPPASSQGRVSLGSRDEGRTVKTKIAYQFQLKSHEGHNLTCLAEYPCGRSEARTIRIPKYSISLRVLNRTAPLTKHYSGASDILRLFLQDDLPGGQRILLQVNGNVPSHSLTCKRRNGSFVHMEGDALVLRSEVKGEDEGLYICRASFYHHEAIVRFQVEVLKNPKEQFVKLVAVCAASVSAVVMVLGVALWVFWRNAILGGRVNPAIAVSRRVHRRGPGVKRVHDVRVTEVVKITKRNLRARGPSQIRRSILASLVPEEHPIGSATP
ncbi:unnamed protein product [Merluccius merluccius]